MRQNIAVLATNKLTAKTFVTPVVCLISRQDPEMLLEKRVWIQINCKQLLLTQVITWFVGVGKEDETSRRGKMSTEKTVEEKG